MPINFLEDYPKRWRQRIQRVRLEVTLAGLLFLSGIALVWMRMPSALSAMERNEFAYLQGQQQQGIPENHGLNLIYKFLLWQADHLVAFAAIEELRVESGQLTLSLILSKATDFSELIQRLRQGGWQIVKQSLQQDSAEDWIAEFTLQASQREQH